MKDIFYQALINMGYRPLNDEQTMFGKPIGFGILIVEIDDTLATFKTMFRTRHNEVMIWKSVEVNMNDYFDGLEGEVLYKKCVFRIARTEFNVETEKIIYSKFPLAEPYDFKTNLKIS